MRICCRACRGLWAPPARQPWHGQAVCCAALMSRRMVLREAEAAVEDIVERDGDGDVGRG